MAAIISGAFMAAIVSGAFIEAILAIFMVDVLQGFMAITVFLAMTVFSFPDSMDTRDGGVGVIPIRIGLTRITPGILTILTIHIIPISVSSRRTSSCPGFKVGPEWILYHYRFSKVALNHPHRAARRCSVAGISRS